LIERHVPGAERQRAFQFGAQVSGVWPGRA
jgi:hypothetical protein